MIPFDLDELQKAARAKERFDLLHFYGHTPRRGTGW